jgi:DNA-binding protein H-NS
MTQNVPLEILESLELDELEVLKQEVEQVIAKKREERFQALRAEVIELATKLGVPFETLIARFAAEQDKKRRGRPGGSGAGRKIPFRYRHPTDPEKGWTGRGLPPKWLKEWEASGRSREELLIVQNG